MDIFINKTLLENANPFSKEEIFRKKDELTIADNYDASFWNNYEVIPLPLLREKTESN